MDGPNEDPGPLDVYLCGEHCGTINPRGGRLYDFAYTDAWRARGGPGISLALKVDQSPIPEQLARAYFGGLLPEGRARRAIAEETGVDELDDVALLGLLGRECAGAVTIVPAGEPAHVPASESHVRWLSERELHEVLESMRIPGSASALDTYSVSLAGAQRKRGLVLDGSGVMGIPEGNELSTHIVKLAADNFPGIVQNEHAIQCLAGDVGLRASETSVQLVAGDPVIQVTRYDRQVRTAGVIDRLHQEDMCQALGRLSSHKYERFDGVRAVGPTIQDIVAIIRNTARPSIEQVDTFLRLVWFNIIVGNVDAHAKNYSVLYDSDLRRYSIAPLYDSICVSAFHAHKPRRQRVAEEPLVMHIGGQTRFWQLTREDMVRHANSLSIQPGFLLRQVAKLVARTDAMVDARFDSLMANPKTRHDILETARREIHERCAFLASLLA